MSSPTSKANKMIKKFGKMAEQYEDRIKRQAHIIDKLMAAHAVYGDLAYGIEKEAESLEQAKEWAVGAQARVKEILAVPTSSDSGETPAESAEVETTEEGK